MSESANERRLDPLVRLRGGRVTARLLTWYKPRKREFIHRYCPCIRGVFIKTRSGLKFCTREDAIAAGRRFVQANKD